MEKLKFWGLRGSYPCCGSEYVDFGGNTTCVSIEVDNKCIIFDAGTGIINLGREYFDKYDEFYIFLSHFHSDHIQGLSFFKPIFNKSKSVYIYGMNAHEASTKELLYKHFDSIFFPAEFEKLPGIKNIIDMEGDIVLGNTKVEGKTFDIHPKDGITLFRLTYSGKVIVFATDIEVDKENRGKILEFFDGADILLHDSTYLDRDYHMYKGWGHSTQEIAIEDAILAEVKDLYLIHYNPEEGDAALLKREDMVKTKYKNVQLPREGDEVVL